MQPIVNGLEADFQGQLAYVRQLAFVRRNATTPEGKAEMSDYQLRGHPSYVLVDPSGTLLWSGFGPVAEDALREQLEKNARR